MSQILKSYDIIGSREKAIAIIEKMENPEEFAKKIIEKHKNVKTVLMKLTERSGIERTRDYKIILGEKNTEIKHKESGCIFKLDPTKVYFSVREGTERLRIASMVKPNETVLVMFAGVGPYPIIIAKKQKKINKIFSIEINPIAFEYMKENIKLNKVENKIDLFLGDVKEVSHKFFGLCDRVVMPLPHEAKNYINEAERCLKNKGFIHLYFIASESKVDEEVEKIIEKIKTNFQYTVKKVLPYSPRTYKYCLDIQFK
ncbi:MAG: class I SAM-dependent methyltransferase family protein [Candidatus Aenigmatarchaeota archaeon]